MWSTRTSVVPRVVTPVAMLSLLLAGVVSSESPARHEAVSPVMTSAAAVAPASATSISRAARRERRMERRRSRVGFSPGFSILYEELPQLRQDLAGMYALGARRIRVDLSWALVERDRGRYDWSHSDRVFREARAAGLRVLPVIGYQPGWAGREGIDVSGFSAFAAAAADRYGNQIRAWEVWNEPNLERFWFGRPDPVAYGRMVSSVSSTIRQHDDDARIVMGALAPAVDDPSGSEVSPETFLRGAGKALSPGDFDAVSVHPYSYPVMPRSDHDWNTFHRLPEMLTLAREIGGRRVRLWLTEYGAPTGQSDRSVRPRRQARMLVQAVRRARRLRGVGPIYLYSYRDVSNDLGDAEANFGLLRHDGERKRAARALRNALIG